MSIENFNNKQFYCEVYDEPLHNHTIINIKLSRKAAINLIYKLSKKLILKDNFFETQLYTQHFKKDSRFL